MMESPLGVKEKFAKAKAKYDQFKKAKEYYSAVKNLIDEDTRSAELFKQGLKYSMKLGEKFTGLSLTNHPYFKIHKAHFELLGSALSAVDTHHNAMNALASAVASADQVALLSEQVEQLRHRMRGIQLMYWVGAGSVILEIRRVNGTSRAEQLKFIQELKDSGATPKEYEGLMDDAVMAVRAEIVELYLSAQALMAMVEIEYQATVEAYARFTKRVAKLQGSKKSIDVVAGKAAERDQQYEWFDREWDLIHKKKSVASPEAVKDPSAYAKPKRDEVVALTEMLANMADEMMSGRIYDPEGLALAIAKP